MLVYNSRKWNVASAPSAHGTELENAHCYHVAMKSGNAKFDIYNVHWPATASVARQCWLNLSAHIALASRPFLVLGDFDFHPADCFLTQKWLFHRYSNARAVPSPSFDAHNVVTKTSVFESTCLSNSFCTSDTKCSHVQITDGFVLVRRAARDSDAIQKARDGAGQLFPWIPTPTPNDSIPDVWSFGDFSDHYPIVVVCNNHCQVLFERVPPAPVANRCT